MNSFTAALSRAQSRSAARWRAAPRHGPQVITPAASQARDPMACRSVVCLRRLPVWQRVFYRALVRRARFGAAEAPMILRRSGRTPVALALLALLAGCNNTAP